MDTKTDKKIDQFLETNNMDYLYLILANLEVERLSNLPDFVKKNFTKKISDMALEHTAENDIPDFILEQLELENLENNRNAYNDYDDEDEDFDDLNYNPAVVNYDEDETPAKDFVPLDEKDDDDNFDEDDDFDFDNDFDDED